MQTAKNVSKASMIFAAIWIPVLSIIRAIWGLFTPVEFGLTVSEIIMVGIAVAAVFSPVYFSIILDKIKEIRIGGREK
jgi:hypothetical protein